MAHFAELDDNNVVQRVIVVSNKNTSDADGNEDESIGIAFCKTLHGSDTIWKQCSYNALIRKSFPSPGFIYSESLDAFIHPQPYPSWTLDEHGSWAPPIEEPELTAEQIRLGYYYSWNDKIYQADSNEPKTLGWALFTPQIITITQQPVDVTVSTGSSATFTGRATVNKGVLGYGLQKQDDDGDFFPVTSYYTTGELSVNAFCNTGIVTSGDNGSKYRLEFAPFETGIVGYSTTVTLTVTD